MSGIAVVFVGGGIGAVLRHGVNLTAFRLFGPGLPLGTLSVNILGSFAMGAFWAYVVAHLDETLPNNLRLLIATGFLGGFTTFSAFSPDVVHLWERGAEGAAVGYGFGSLALSVAALVAGLWTARAVII